MSVTVDSVLVQDKHLPAADLDGGIVVLDVDAGAYLGFNRVASEIWHLLSEPRRVDEIFDSLSQNHDVDAATLACDVLPFLQGLIERGLARQLDQDDTG